MTPKKNGGEPEEQLTFESAYQRLEQTVQALEAGGLTLDEATGLYAEGARLARVCNELLSSAELRITRLQTSLGEQMRFIQDAPGLQEEEEEYEA